MRIAVLILAATAAVAHGAGDRRADRRLEADRALESLLRKGSVPAAIARLEFLGEQDHAARVLTEALRGPLADAGRRDVAQALSLLATRDAEPALRRLTRDDDPAVRMSAASGLARLRSDAVDVLEPLLDDRSPPVRREAARALGALRRPALGKRLMAAAKAEGDPEVRTVLLVATGQSGDPKQVKPLESFLASSSESTREAAARGLCALGAPSGLAYAQRLLGSDDRWERRAGVALFEGVPAKRAAKVLRPLLDDPDRGLAATAARILHQGGDHEVLEWMVVQASQAQGDDKLAFERELEPLHLADDERRVILTRALKQRNGCSPR